jgi:hypothetical protein
MILKNLTLTDVVSKFEIMIKRLKIRFLWILILLGFLFTGCKRENQDTPYDLFPLKVGNEFYYKYQNKKLFEDTEGTEAWKVISESSQEGSIKYVIERKLNAVYTVLYNQRIITDSISYLEVTEDPSSVISSLFLSYSNISFQRYQNVSHSVIEHSFQADALQQWKYLFVADSGLTSYQYHHAPNSITDITLHLDSLKKIP